MKVVGDYKPGRVTASITDLTVPAPGLAIQIQRTYDSLTRATTADFDYGWTLGVNIQTEISPTGDVTLTLNGRRRRNQNSDSFSRPLRQEADAGCFLCFRFCSRIAGRREPR